MKIGIIGYGYVGKAIYNYFKNHYETIWYDPFIEGSCTKEEINECYLAVVCVFTPMSPNGECDLSIVREVLKWIESPLILLKSTIAIGTTKKLIEETKKRIVFSPEYIGESTYDTGYFNFNKNVQNHSFFIFGGNKEDTAEIVPIFQKISGPTKIYKQTDPTSAEIAKYMENSFFATKVIFCYEYEQICKKFNCDYNEVRELWLLDPRIGHSHTCVFKENTKPFDGKCLPKDLSAIIYSATEEGYKPEFLEEVQKSNERLENIRK